MNKKSKILIALVLVMVLAAISLVIITLGADPSYKKGVINVAITWGDGNEDLQSFFDEYPDPENRSVLVDSRLREDDIEELLSGDNPPDLIILSTSEVVKDLAARGDLGSLDALTRDHGIALDDFFSASISQCRASDNSLLCLPWGNDVYALYWNKGLFKAAGLDPDRPPENLEELIDYASQLTRFDEEGNQFEQMGFLPDFPRSYLDQYSHLFGGALRSTDGNPVFPAAVEEAVDWELKLVEPYELDDLNSFYARANYYRNSGHPVFAGRRANCQQCHRTAPGNSEKMPDLAFYRGELAMMVDGQWQDGAKYLRAFAPTLDYGVVPIPAPAEYEELQGSSLIQGPVIIIPANAADLEAAGELAAWLLSPSRQAAAAAAFDFLPSRISAVEFLNSANFPNLAVFLGILTDRNTSINEPLEGSWELNQTLIETEKKVLHEALSSEVFLAEVQEGLE